MYTCEATPPPEISGNLMPRSPAAPQHGTGLIVTDSEHAFAIFSK